MSSKKLKRFYQSRIVTVSTDTSNMPIYSSIHALRDAFAEDPNKFPLGFVAQVKREGKRKPDNYELVEMNELGGSTMHHLHWVFQVPPPKASRHSTIDWARYNAKKGW